MASSRTHSRPAPPPAPLLLNWDRYANPLPSRLVQATGRPTRSLSDLIPPWIDTGDVNRPFDFCGHMRRLTADIALRCDAFRHLDVNKLLFSFTQARNTRRHGLQARVTPLRCRDGKLHRTHRGVRYQVQRYFVDGIEQLYVVSFCLPRFLNQEFDDKCVTLFHELYHISPSLNGDLRRHAGRCEVHTASQERYDQQMAELAREYMQSRPDPTLHAFLRLNFTQLVSRHQAIEAVLVPHPKLVPVTDVITEDMREVG